MIYDGMPDDFNPKFKVVSCFVECGNEFLMLQRMDSKSEGGKWGVPAGKLNPGESSVDAVVRELYEETGIRQSPFEMGYFRKLFVRYPEYDFIYHMFKVKLEQKPEVKIKADEHKGFCWATPEEALKLPLILDEDSCIRMYFKI